MGAAVVRWPAGVGMADATFELALGLLRSDPAGHFRRRDGIPEFAAHDARTPTDRCGRDQTCANVGCWTTGRRGRDAAARRPAVGLVGGGSSGWRCGGSSGGAATTYATRILEVSARPPSGRADPRASRRCILRR